MAFRSERSLIPVITRLARQSKTIDEAIELIQSVLAGEIGGSTLFIEPLEEGISPRLAHAAAALMDARQFPFRGLYTAPINVGSRRVGRLIACFASFGAPGKSLPDLTSHVAEQLSGILARTGRSLVSHNATRVVVQPEAA